MLAALQKLLLPGLVLALAGCGGEVNGLDGSNSDSLSGAGLSGAYYSGTAFNTLVKTRQDAQVGFDWGTASPMTGLASDAFSVRWTGKLTPSVSGRYTLTTTSDDGVRLSLNGALVIDNWTQHAAKADTGTVSLTAGTAYDLKLEYFEQGGRAVMKLAWTPPGGTSVLIPSANLSSGSPGTAGGVSISGHTLLRDGKPWTPKGLSMIGSLTCGAAIAAYAHWGAAEVAAARSFGADAFRFQVSQPYLDFQSPQYQASYLTRIQEMVSLAQSSGFAVILSMQDQSLACGNADPMPTDSTVRAWTALAPVFKNNANVLYELYNEPQNQASASGWAQWKNGGSGTVGHQALLTLVRNLGAQNVVLADGAQHAELLTGIPLLNDPLNKVGYAAHPYYLEPIVTNANAWDERFGYLAATQVVVITEWSEHSSSGAGCNSDDPVLSKRLISYAQGKSIGIFGWAFDLPGTLVLDWSWTPTNADAWTCGAGHNGTGGILKASFLP